MKKKLIDVYQSELIDKIFPLTIHFAITKEQYFEDDKNTQYIDGYLPKSRKRYGTKRFIAGNKFYKPISRILNV